ncbi:MAG: Gfo/Idh/MocA family oxidoreductase [Planctomycetaceae bacterium]|nr:Gfo/Idh/MocA family oxidoreductase [Planctomycetaceae bacterium]
MQTKQPKQDRRRFLKHTGIVTAGALAGAAIPMVHAAEDNTVKIGLVGCGGRGTGALMNAMSTEGPKKIVALGDVFQNKVQNTAKMVTDKHKDSADIPQERQFVGFEAYKNVVDAVGPGGVVFFATAPAFRPMHVEYAVEKGVNVFMEKSFAVDAPGIRRMLKAGEKAKEKNLKIVGGLMSRHNKATQAAIEQLHNGIIGERILCRTYREHGPVGLSKRQADESVLSHQIRNYSNFTWLNGSFFLDWLIHGLDVACWAKGAWPVDAQGQGGRAVRKEKDTMFDHYSIEYSFADGTRLLAQGRHQANTWNCFHAPILGEKGLAVLGEVGPESKNPAIYKGFNPVKENIIWRHPGVGRDAYVVEHDVLFDAIRNDKPVNETERCCYAAMTGILGRMAAFSGQKITWDEALASNIELAPNLDKLSLDGDAPIMPDANGDYPVAVPGQTKVL